jgi:hypothetical protein
MGRKGRVRVAGPLAAFADEFGAELERLGYSRFTVEAQLQLMVHVSGWLEERGLGAGELTAARVEQYLVYRRACGHVHRCSPRALAPLLAYLRGLGVAPPATPALALTATDRPATRGWHALALSDGQLKVLKNRRQPRTVKLLAPLHADLATWRQAASPSPSSPVFPSASGAFWRASDWRNWRKRVYKPSRRSSASMVHDRTTCAMRSPRC